MTVQVIEAGGGLGGVWYWNCYRGARVDSPARSSRDDLWRKWQFSELYPSWQEFRSYFRHVDEQLGLSRDIRFNRRVDEASFEPARNRWLRGFRDQLKRHRQSTPHRKAIAMSSNPKTIKIPGPDHPITIEHNRDRVVVKVAGRVVADTFPATRPAERPRSNS
jgi:cyclohexanone monooxygenase